MKNMREFRGQKYIIMLIMSIALSCITVYANDKAIKQQEVTQQEMLNEKEIILSLQQEVEALKNEIRDVKQELALEQDEQSKTYIAQKDVTAFLETSSYSKVMGTFKAGSVIKANMITEDGVWIETDQGFVKRIFVTPLEEAYNEIFFEISQPNNQEQQKPNKEEVVAPKQYKTGVTGKSGLTKEDLDYLLAGSPMAGCSEAVLKIEEQHGVNAFFTISVAQAETQRGLTGTGKSKNNAFGIISSKGGYRYFNSLADSVIEFGGMMERVYISKGRNTISKVHAIYTSSPNWAGNVTAVMNKELAKIKAK